MTLSESTTTETKTYTLEKYSRAYSPKTTSGPSEWQHFTNPVLRLILDTKQSPERAESFRLRIVWTMNGGSASGVAQQDVVLEDLDLLAFSSLRDDKSDSSPLKGVYRDTTFGLRYLHVSDSPDSPKVYRRFQVSFATAASALQLVEAIRDVCPCKPTESNGQERKKTVAVPLASRQVHQSVVPNAWQKTAPHPTAPVPIPVQRVPTMRTIPVPDAPAVFTSSPSPLLSSQPELPPPFSASSRGAPASSPYRPWYPAPNATQPPASTSKPLPASFPDSSPPPSSADSVMMPPPPPLPPSAETLIAALREATGLYDLSHAALERLVGDVVREDKFVNLLDSMSSMWAAKALLTTTL
ncbi:hypothetical protein B0H17DRAFT_1075604 [Mycena rosella]|uniref:Uncharacterized protein n=1 Tax=Mycena rosella TaxID=1033263 RepID=A0AAD7D745_MYCRO|nr:hypothetical protein B0H17DRAFT_1075604 [Mycena rosella]